MSWAMMAAAGVGLAKGELVDRPEADRKRMLASNTQRYAHLTGQQALPFEEADPIGNAVAFGTTAKGIEQRMADAKADNDLKQAKMEYYQARTPLEGAGSGVDPLEQLESGDVNDATGGASRGLASSKPRQTQVASSGKVKRPKGLPYTGPWGGLYGFGDNIG